MYHEGDLLVDGGYLNNIPVDAMRALGVGSGAHCTPSHCSPVDRASGMPWNLHGWDVQSSSLPH